LTIIISCILAGNSTLNRYLAGGLQFGFVCVGDAGTCFITADAIFFQKLLFPSSLLLFPTDIFTRFSYLETSVIDLKLSHSVQNVYGLLPLFAI